MWAWLLPLIKKIEPILCWIAITALLGWMTYVTIIKPHTNPTPTTTVQSGGVSNTYQIKVGLGGCARIPSPTEVKK